MARGVNKVILIGNLGADPEVRYSASGTAMATVNLATAESWMDKQTNQWQERTEWHRLVMFARTAEVAGEYLRKGSQIYVEGRLQTRKWQDQNGADRYTTEIVVNEMQMLGGRGGEANANAGYGGGNARPAPAAGNQYAPPPASNAPAGGGSYSPPPARPAPASPAPAGNTPPPADFDDDIPF